MVRYSIAGTLTIANGAQDSDGVDLRRFAGALMLIAAGWTGGASVTFKGSSKSDLSDEALVTDTDGTTDLSQAVTADRWVPIPEHAMKAGHLQIRSVGATSREESVLVMGKS